MGNSLLVVLPMFAAPHHHLALIRSGQCRSVSSDVSLVSLAVRMTLDGEVESAVHVFDECNCCVSKDWGGRAEASTSQCLAPVDGAALGPDRGST